MLDYIVKHTKAYLEEKSKTDRKLIGQFLHRMKLPNTWRNYFLFPPKRLLEFLILVQVQVF